MRTFSVLNLKMKRYSQIKSIRNKNCLSSGKELSILNYVNLKPYLIEMSQNSRKHIAYYFLT